MSEMMREIANGEISDFSVRVLGYDREDPNAGQRKPGEILREVEERMALNKSRWATMQKGVGAVVLVIITFILTTSMTGATPAVIAWLRAFL